MQPLNLNLGSQAVPFGRFRVYQETPLLSNAFKARKRLLKSHITDPSIPLSTFLKQAFFFFFGGGGFLGTYIKLITLSRRPDYRTA